MLNLYDLKRDAPAVARAPTGHENRIFDALTLAFAADPAVRWMFPDPQQYLRHFPKFAQAFGGAAIECGTALAGDAYAGAALWLPPDVHPDDAALTEVISQGVAIRERDTAFALFEEMARYHPSEPCWYLPLIGVEPARQGRSLGSAMLQPILARCDAERQTAYLEATNPRNRSLYERHGFEATGVIKVGDCPPITAMCRRARPR